MAQAQIPSSLNKILKLSLTLIAISGMVVTIIGYSAGKINNEIKVLEDFIINAEQSQPNFETSLEMYTEKTKDIIEFLLKLRPSTEEEYVKFISEVENIGQTLSLDISLESVNTALDKKEKKDENANSISYAVFFYGNRENLKDFLKELEKLNYFIKVVEIKYKNLTILESETTGEIRPNIEVRIKLYTK